MGLRPQLPLTPPTQPGPATLARPLQPNTATQLDRRPTPDQPHSQRVWVEQLEAAAGGRVAAAGWTDAPFPPAVEHVLPDAGLDHPPVGDRRPGQQHAELQ